MWRGVKVGRARGVQRLLCGTVGQNKAWREKTVRDRDKTRRGVKLSCSGGRGEAGLMCISKVRRTDAKWLLRHVGRNALPCPGEIAKIVAGNQSCYAVRWAGHGRKARH